MEARARAGIELHDTALRYAELERRGDRYQLLRLGSCDFDFGVLDELQAEAPRYLDIVGEALRDVLARAELFSSHQVQREALSVRERMSEVLSRLNGEQFVEFTSLFKPEEGRLGLVVTFLAVLELLKESLIKLVQAEPFAAIYVKAAADG